MVRQVVSPFDLSRTLLVGGGLLVPCSSPGPPTTHANGYYGAWPGWAFSVSVLPLTEAFVLGNLKFPEWFQCVDFPSTDFDGHLNQFETVFFFFSPSSRKCSSSFILASSPS